MRIKGKVINVNQRQGGGAAIVYDAKAVKNYAFFLADVAGYDPERSKDAGIEPGDEVSGELTSAGVLKAVKLEAKAKAAPSRKVAHIR